MPLVTAPGLYELALAAQTVLAPDACLGPPLCRGPGLHTSWELRVE